MSNFPRVIGRRRKAFAKEVIGCFVAVLVFSILIIRPPECSTQKVGVVMDRDGEYQPCSVCHKEARK